MSKRSLLSLSRADFLKLGGVGAAGLLAGGAWAASRDGGSSAATAAAPSAATLAATKNLHLAATDGHVALPGRPAYPDPDVYVFGFVRVPDTVTPKQLDRFKGHVQAPATMIGVDEEDELFITMTNIGLVVRPDLDDSHTIHWHGFPNATAIFDGVPEVSVAVPPGRDFPYYYKVHRTGSFMYHCHFEDVEHVQMGMNGSVFVYPAGHRDQAYADPATAFDREFALHLNEVWTTPHDNLESIQETVWPNYKANYWIMNGRCYPDTIRPNNDPDRPAQPLSSLIQMNAGETGLLRFSNLGYEQQAMQLTGLRMKVVGEDASILRNTDGLGDVDLSYETNTIYIGPGEARDALFTAPAFNAGAVETDDAGNYNRYWLRNRSAHRLINDGYAGLGGQLTEVRVYQAGTLASQTHPNETYPEFTPPAIPDSHPTSFYMDPWYTG